MAGGAAAQVASAPWAPRVSGEIDGEFLFGRIHDRRSTNHNKRPRSDVRQGDRGHGAGMPSSYPGVRHRATCCGSRRDRHRSWTRRRSIARDGGRTVRGCGRVKRPVRDRLVGAPLAGSRPRDDGSRMGHRTIRPPETMPVNLHPDPAEPKRPWWGVSPITSRRKRSPSIAVQVGCARPLDHSCQRNPARTVPNAHDLMGG